MIKILILYKKIILKEYYSILFFIKKFLSLFFNTKKLYYQKYILFKLQIYILKRVISIFKFFFVTIFTIKYTILNLNFSMI